ncbi:MAG: hypothetical protein HYS22_00405 [Deltaproteobacteria bacterium]|nr:hypothetical protein [Deltaproteobacteria bacterium]
MPLYKRFPRKPFIKEIRASLPGERLLLWIHTRRRQSLAILSVTVVVTLLVLSGFFLWQHHQRERMAHLLEQVSQWHAQGTQAMTERKWDEAIRIFQLAVQEKDNPLRDLSRLYLAECYEISTKRAEAIQLYSKIAKEGKSSGLKETARQKELWLRAGL